MASNSLRELFLDFAKEGLAGGHKIVGGFLKAGGDSLFTLGKIGTGIVILLVAHFAINLEHTGDVFAHVGDDRAGEGVLRVGVDVHLDDAVGNGFADIGKFGTGTAMEDEGHASMNLPRGARASYVISISSGEV